MNYPFLLKFSRCENGAVLVEATVVLPLLLLMLLGGIELSRGISYHHQADKAIRDATRYMARLQTVTDPPDAVTAKAVAVAAGICPISGTDICEVKDFRYSPDRFAAGYVRLEAEIEYEFPLLSIMSESITVTFTVSHEQPYIGG